MSRKSSRLVLALIAVAVAVAGGQALEKKRVAARGDLTGSGEILQLVTWETHNSSSNSPHHQTAHLAVETTGRDRRAIWQTDGGDTYYRIDSLRLADLNGDGLPEIIGLWRVRPSEGTLRLFHWERAKETFIEVSSKDELKGVRSYRIVNGRLLAYLTSSPSSRRAYELRGSELLSTDQRNSEARMPETKQEESGIEGITEIKASPPITRENDPEPVARPFQTSLVIVTKNEGREVARVQSGSDGRFRVQLPPGEYIIRALRTTKIGSPRASDHLAKVSPGQFIFVRITFDSGLQ
jgi:hypothetical protein